MAWSACSVAEDAVRPLVSILVANAALPNRHELFSLPQWKVAYPASASDLGSRGTPGGAAVAR